MKFLAKTVSLNSLMTALSRGEGLRLTERAIIKHFRKEPRTFGRRARQRHSKTSRFHATCRNATRVTQRCGQERRHFAGGGTPPPLACFSCQFCHAQHQKVEPGLCPPPLPRDSTVATSTTSIPPDTSAEVSLSRFGFREILELTGNMPPKRRYQGVSRSSRPSVKT